MIHQVENALALAQYGFCAETIKLACPDVPPKIINDNAITKRPWQERKIPSNVFSSALDGKTLIKRQLSVTAVMRYFEFRSTRRSFAFSGIVNHDPLITMYLDRTTYPKVAPEYDCTTIEIDLFTLARAYYMSMHGFLDADPTAIPTINETLNLVEGIYTGDFFLIDCLCGRPVLAENKPARGPDGDFLRDFLTCPWCGKRNRRHNEHFERELEKYCNWVGVAEDYMARLEQIAG